MSENLFMKLGLDEKLASALSRLGFEEPTPIQTHSIPALLEGRDVLGQAATGTGKTAAFSLPLIQRYCLNSESKNPKVLILTPTRELCIQVSEAILSYSRDSGVYVTPIYGGQDYSRQIKALNRGVHIVVATPGRALEVPSVFKTFKPLFSTKLTKCLTWDLQKIWMQFSVHFLKKDKQLYSQLHCLPELQRWLKIS